MLPTFCASLNSSSLANANHRSTSFGQHSTARANKILAFDSSSKSTVAFHSVGDVGRFSKALRKTLLLAFS